MNNDKLLLFGIILFLIPIVHSTLESKTIAYYSMDNNCTYDDSLQGRSGTAFNNPTIVSGKSNNACLFMTNQWVNITKVTEQYNFGEPFSIAFWRKMNRTSAIMCPFFITRFTTDVNYIANCFVDYTGLHKLEVDSYTVLGNHNKVDPAFTSDGNYSWIFTYFYIDADGKVHDYMIDGSYIGNSTTNINNFNLGMKFYLGKYDDDGGTSLYYDGLIDEFMIFNDSLTMSEVNSLLTGYKLNFTTEGALIPSMSLNKGSPLDNQQSISYLNFNFNGTMSNTQENNYECLFYSNSNLLANQTNVNLSKSQNFSYQYNINKGNFSVNCTNTNTSSKIFWYNITIDVIEPMIQIISPLNSTEWYSDTDYYQNITLNDTNLDGWNISYYWNDSGTLRLRSSDIQTNQVGGWYILNNLTNSSAWCTKEPCQIYLNVTSWDSHNPIETKHEKYKTIVNTGDMLRLEFDQGWIQIQSNDTDYFNIYDEDNKYKIEFKTKKNKDVVFQISSNVQYYQKNDEYKAHFVFPSILKYFDLQSEDIEIKKIEYKKDSWLITFDTTKDKVKTNSIGDLHIASKVVLFSIIERPSLSDLYLSSMNITLTNMDKTTTKIYEVIEILPLIFLYLGLLISGIWLCISRNLTMGITMILSTIPFDIFFWITYETTWYIGLMFIPLIILKLFGIYGFRIYKKEYR